MPYFTSRKLDLELSWYSAATASLLFPILLLFSKCGLDPATNCEPFVGLMLYDGFFRIDGTARMIFNISVFGYPCDGEVTSTMLSTSTEQKLFEPFKILSSVHKCHIDGPVSQGYKDSLVRQVCRQSWTVEDFHQKITSLTDGGRNDFLGSRFASAIGKYETAVKELQCMPWVRGLDNLIPQGPFVGQTYAAAYKYLQWRLPSIVVAAYRKLGQWHDAYEWVCYAIRHAGNAGYHPRDHAVKFFRKAMVSNELGEHRRVWKEYCVGKEGAVLDLAGIWEDCEMGVLRRPLVVPLHEWRDLQDALY